MTWRGAFLEQAKSDYSLFTELNQTRKARCHQLHYLQMATEKLAKSFLCDRHGRPPPKSHFAFTRFLKISKGRPEIRRKLGYASNYIAYCVYVDNLLPAAAKVEALAPTGTDTNEPNPEYPCEETAGNVLAPANYGFREFSRVELIHLQTFVNNLLRTTG